MFYLALEKPNKTIVRWKARQVQESEDSDRDISEGLPGIFMIA